MVTTEFREMHPATGSRLRAVAAVALVRAGQLWRAYQNRRSVARLLDWDDRMLRDIGVTANDVRSALASPLAEDPSFRLGDMSRERRSAHRAQAEELYAGEFRLQTRADIWRNRKL